MYDVIILGAGPAGLTAGIYSSRSGLKTLILEKETIGGQISSSPLVENYPGFEKISGAELSNNMYEQAIKSGCELEIEEVLKITDGKIKTVKTDMNEYKAKVVIIATGCTYRKLGLVNEDNFIGKGIHFCTSCDGAFYKDKTVAVIGGGSSAVINAIYMSNIAKKVYLIYRKDKLKAEKVMIERLKNIPNIEILYNTVITKLPEEELNYIEIYNGQESKKLQVDGIFESVGLNPNSKIFNDLIEMDENGHIKSNDCLTNKTGIFVCGDIRGKTLRQVSTAISDGAISATLALKYINEMEQASE